ncbi:MAG: hypothetical protein LH474_01540 [Chamaesiphon sp.]|nr:hypothetical protein [Chamaesiphon sp.]
MKILLVLPVLILLGTLVGSNLSPEITVIVLSQPTIILPIGLWLLMAIGLGLCSSILIQLAIFIDRRLLQRNIRQLQTRLQQSDEDVFTYTSSVPESDRVDSTSDRKSPQQNNNTSKPKKSLFNSYRSPSVVEDPASSADRSTNKPSAKQIVNDSDDWEVEPASNRQLEWEDSIPPRQQNSQSSNRSTKFENTSIYSEQRNQKIDSQPEQTRREVYDADFRLIQPPYKQPVETEFDDDRESGNFEYTEIDGADDFDTASSVKSPVDSHSIASKNSDDEDWGFDFEDRDPPVRAN